MPKLKVTRFRQDPAHCAVAACACVANYYEPHIDYQAAKKKAYRISKKIPDIGMDSGEICRLLNALGFNKVTLVTSNLNIFDYQWAKYGRKRLLNTLIDSKNNKDDSEAKSDTRSIITWLRHFEYDNNVIITYDFAKHMKNFINKRRPFVMSFNWTTFFKFPKEGEHEVPDPVNGQDIEHAVTCYGYDSRGVNICDSHHRCYKYSRKYYRRGFYKIPWLTMMTVLGKGDLYLPE